MQDDDGGKVVPFPERPGNPWPAVGRALSDRLKGGESIRDALVAELGDAELHALTDRVWPRARRCEGCAEAAGILASVADEFPDTRDFILTQLAATPGNRAEFRAQAVQEAAERRRR